MKLTNTINPIGIIYYLKNALDKKPGFNEILIGSKDK